jgi:hypothetical protein
MALTVDRGACVRLRARTNGLASARGLWSLLLSFPAAVGLLLPSCCHAPGGNRRRAARHLRDEGSGKQHAEEECGGKAAHIPSSLDRTRARPSRMPEAIQRLHRTDGQSLSARLIASTRSSRAISIGLLRILAGACVALAWAYKQPLFVAAFAAEAALRQSGRGGPISAACHQAG